MVTQALGARAGSGADALPGREATRCDAAADTAPEHAHRLDLKARF